MSFDPTSVLSGIRNKRRTLQTPEGSVDHNTEKSDYKEQKPPVSQARSNAAPHPPESKVTRDDDLTKTTINLLAEQLSILQNRVKEVERLNQELTRENEALKRERENYFSAQRLDHPSSNIPSTLRGSRDVLHPVSPAQQLSAYNSKSNSDLHGKGYGSIPKQTNLKPPQASHASPASVFNKKLSSLTVMTKSPVNWSSKGGSNLHGKNHSSSSSSGVTNGYLGLYNSKSLRNNSQDGGSTEHLAGPRHPGHYGSPAVDVQREDGYDQEQDHLLQQNPGAHLGSQNEGGESPSEFEMFRWFAADSQHSSHPGENEAAYGPTSGWRTGGSTRTPVRTKHKDDSSTHTAEGTPVVNKTPNYDSKTRRALGSDIAGTKDLRLEILEQIVRLHPNTPVPHVTIDF